MRSLSRKRRVAVLHSEAEVKREEGEEEEDEEGGEERGPSRCGHCRE